MHDVVEEAEDSLKPQPQHQFPIPMEELELEEPQFLPVPIPTEEPQFLQVPIPTEEEETEEAEEPQHPNEPPVAVLLLEGLDTRHMLVVPRLVVVVVPRLALVVDTHTDTDLRMHEEEDRIHTVDADYSHQLPQVGVEEGHRRLVHPNVEEEGRGSYRDRDQEPAVVDAPCQYRHQMFPLAETSWQHQHRPILQSY